MALSIFSPELHRCLYSEIRLVFNQKFIPGFKIVFLIQMNNVKTFENHQNF